MMMEMAVQAVLWTSGIMAVIGAIGLVRFPDFYTRIHAATVICIGSFTLAMLAFFMGTFWGEYSAKIIAIIFINLLANPTSSHAIADAAYRVGIIPKGAKRDDLKDAERSRGRTGK